MIRDILAGKIECIVVKDLSRPDQEHIETGCYLRQIFPAYGVRFISVNDGVDTANEQNGDDLHITLKNLLNAPYSRDISVKTRSTLLTKRRNGSALRTPMSRSSRSGILTWFRKYTVWTPGHPRTARRSICACWYAAAAAGA